MPEMIAAHITIGGQARNDLVADLCALIAQEDLALDWDGKQFSPRTAKELLAARQTEGMRIQLFADAASWGQFELLEQFLIEHQIPFDRHHDAKYEIASTTLFYRPEFGCQEYLTDANEKVVCPARPLRGLATSLKQVREQLRGGEIAAAEQLIAACIDQLDAHMPTEVPPLPPLEITGLTADNLSSCPEPEPTGLQWP